MGVKEYMLQQQIKHIIVPTCTELSVQRIWVEAMKHPDFQKFMPDSWNGDKRTDRTFFWGILATLAPEYVTHLIKEVERKRHEDRLAKIHERPTNSVVISDKWIGLLLSEDYKPSKSNPITNFYSGQAIKDL